MVQKLVHKYMNGSAKGVHGEVPDVFHKGEERERYAE
jgi:hypothetical protein